MAARDAGRTESMPSVAAVSAAADRACLAPLLPRGYAEQLFKGIFNYGEMTYTGGHVLLMSSLKAQL